jgi:hypothetical protein
MFHLQDGRRIRRSRKRNQVAVSPDSTIPMIALAMVSPMPLSAPLAAREEWSVGSTWPMGSSSRR